LCKNFQSQFCDCARNQEKKCYAENHMKKEVVLLPNMTRADIVNVRQGFRRNSHGLRARAFYPEKKAGNQFGTRREYL